MIMMSMIIKLLLIVINLIVSDLPEQFCLAPCC